MLAQSNNVCPALSSSVSNGPPRCSAALGRRTARRSSSRMRRIETVGERKKMTRNMKIRLLALTLLAGRNASAAPALCSPGYQDSTCVSPIQHGAIPPPVCPAGYTQTNPPVWMGAGWSTPGCQPPSPPPVAVVPTAPSLVSVGYGCPGWTIYAYSDGSVQRVWDPDNPDNVLVQGGACSDRG